jgi:hypothetical protein
VCCRAGCKGKVAAVRGAGLAQASDLIRDRRAAALPAEHRPDRSEPWPPRDLIPGARAATGVCGGLSRLVGLPDSADPLTTVTWVFGLALVLWLLARITRGLLLPAAQAWVRLRRHLLRRAASEEARNPFAAR